MVVALRARFVAHLTGADESDATRIRSPQELLQFMRATAAEASAATPQLAEGGRRFVDEAERCLTVEDAATRLLRTRLAAVWRFVLGHEGRFPTPETAPELNCMHGPASVLRERILLHVPRLARVMVVNREIHAPFYNDLVRRLVTEGPPEASP